MAILRTHRAVLEQSLNYDCVLILEDDIDFIDGFNDKLNDALLSLPDDWDGLHLNGTDYPSLKSTPYNELLLKCHHTTGAFGIVYNCKSIPKVLQWISKEQKEFDVHIADNMRNAKWFRTRQKLVTHQAGWSEKSCNFVDYKDLY